LKANSQVDTKQSKDSVVTIKKEVAKKILLELNECDNIKKELVLLYGADSILNARIKTKDSALTVFDKDVQAHKKIIANMSIQNDVLVNQKNVAEYKFEKEKKKASYTLIGGIIVSLIILLIK
jgi:hypothetical protein